MDKYKAGAFADAVVIWDSIYEELGPDKGYRLAFDLARAYDQLGEGIKAADHYDTYLEKVRARRAEGEVLEPKVAKQEEIARERRDVIVASKGRIEVRGASRGTVAVRVDNAAPRVAPFLVYVEPGNHAVTFGRGRDAEVQSVALGRGELVTVGPHEEEMAREPVVPQIQVPVERPFSPAVLWVGAGVTVASLLLPVAAYANALSIKSKYDKATTTSASRRQLAQDYETARDNAYASIVVPAVFTATVGALSLWYVLGSRVRRVSVTPSANLGPAGASVGLSGTF